MLHYMLYYYKHSARMWCPRARAMLIVRPEIHSTGVDSPSEFSLLATTEAPGNFVDPRLHYILPYTTLAPSIGHRLR